MLRSSPRNSARPLRSHGGPSCEMPRVYPPRSSQTGHSSASLIAAWRAARSNSGWASQTSLRDSLPFRNSLTTALALSRRGIRDLTVLGGAVRTKRLAMVDDTTRTELDHIAVDVLFISCDGLSFKHGLTTPYREEYTLKRAMIERTQRVVALVDSSKFGNMQMFSFASFDEIDVLVTDTGVDPEAVDILSTHGITVHRA